MKLSYTLGCLFGFGCLRLVIATASPRKLQTSNTVAMTYMSKLEKLLDEQLNSPPNYAWRIKPYANQPCLLVQAAYTNQDSLVEIGQLTLNYNKRTNMVDFNYDSSFQPCKSISSMLIIISKVQAWINYVTKNHDEIHKELYEA